MRKVLFAAWSLSCFIGLGAIVTNGCSSDGAGADVDAALDALPAEDGGARDTLGVNPCHDYPGKDELCSPTKPCPAPLTCYYEPGCDMPIARCRIWDLCPDTLMSDAPMCGCDGGWGNDHEPFANYGPCRDAEVDAGGDGETAD